MAIDAQGSSPTLSLFDGLSTADLSQLLGRLQHRVFPAGATVIAEGDSPHGMYIVVSGYADVLVTDRQGVEHRVSRVGPGATLGEMSLLTGHVTSATVRAVDDLEVLALNEADFQRTAADFPFIYQNLGMILARRLMESNQRGLADQLGNLSVLHDAGAPPLLGYALAASVAWHTRAPVLLLVLGDALPPEVAALAGAEGLAPPVADAAARARVLHAPATGDFIPRRIAQTVERLRHEYGHVLIQATGPIPALLAHQVCLAGAGSPLGAAPDARPGHTLRAWVAGRAQPRPGLDGVLSVPPLEAADERALQAGVLPPATPAGRALGWAARDLAGLKVGLALGAGGVKGYAHLGVVSALQRAGLPIDYLAGTSVGAVVAGLVALGHPPAAIARILDAGDCMLARPSFGLKSLLSDAPVRHYFRSISGRAHIEDLRVPLAIVAADILTRREIVFRRGLLWPATLASIAIPGVLPAQAIGPYRLVDGSIVNPVPADVAAGMGADVVIAIRLRAEPPPARAEVVAREPHGSAPSILEVLTRSVHAMQSRVAPGAESATTIVIEPRCAGAPEFGLRHFSWGRRYVEVGDAAAQEALPRLAAVLPWLDADTATAGVPPA